MFRYFSNVLLIDGPLTRERALDALRNGRVHVVFNAWGTPTDLGPAPSPAPTPSTAPAETPPTGRNAADFAALAASVLRQIGHRHHGVSSLGRQAHRHPQK
jgi:hypothetical protein